MLRYKLGYAQPWKRMHANYMGHFQATPGVDSLAAKRRRNTAERGGTKPGKSTMGKLCMRSSAQWILRGCKVAIIESTVWWMFGKFWWRTVYYGDLWTSCVRQGKVMFLQYALELTTSHHCFPQIHRWWTWMWPFPFNLGCQCSLMFSFGSLFFHDWWGLPAGWQFCMQES